MRRLMIAAALAATTLAGTASAGGPLRLDDGVYSPRTDSIALTPARYRLHSCTARSAVALGYWTAPSLALAKLRALQQCAIRTPRGLRCYITYCR